MASPRLSRRVAKVVRYPPLRDERGSAAGVPRGAARRRLLRGSAGEVAGGHPYGRSGTAAAAPRRPRLAASVKAFCCTAQQELKRAHAGGFEDATARRAGPL